MRRGDRLFELIEVLRRSRHPISAEAIGEPLEVSKRTVYRDIAALMAQNVPIRGEAGIGYVLEPGFHMPPLMLTPDEIEAAVLGAQWVATRGEPELANAAVNLISKLEAIAPSGSETFFDMPSTNVAPVEPPQEGLDSSRIRVAIRNRNKIWISYRDDKGTASERTIWPLFLGYRDAGRIIAAWCELRSAFRYFRTERISAANVLQDKIPQRMDLLKADWQKAMASEREKYMAPSDTAGNDKP
ncbi:YafY family protein [uncultured Roseibium sp.]|uniref:helix-turn-helix transcriptional regulator n=1 Tax=uncultured Roseibium sp. TaxID=1936171 RepID=UPI00261453D9|nr:YafY family protein [uncultured Roseibium sp.]